MPIESALAALSQIRRLLADMHAAGETNPCSLGKLLEYVHVLDLYLTGRGDLTAPDRHPRTAALRDFSNGFSWIVYLSDGGYSRLVLNWEGNWLRLDGPPTPSVLARWSVLESSHATS